MTIFKLYTRWYFAYGKH